MKDSEAQALLDALIEQIAHIAFIKDAKTMRYVRFNRAAEQLTGYTEQEMIGQTADKLMPGHLNKIYQARDLAALQSTTAVETEEVFQNRRGERRTLHVRRTVIRDALGEPLYLIGTANDVTDMQSVLLERNAFFENSLDMMVISSSDGFFKRANPAVTDILGYTPDEFCAIPYLELIHPDDVQRTQEEVSRQMNGDSVMFFENRFRCKDGNYRWLSWRSSPVGSLMYACARDVTKEKESRHRIEKLNQELEERVLQRNHQLQAINHRADRMMSSHMLGIHFWNTRGFLTGANDAFLELIGYSREEIESGTIEQNQLTPYEYREHDLRALEQIMEHGVCKPYEKEYLRKDGTRVSVSIGSAEIDAENGVCYVLDISETKRLERERLALELREQTAIAASQMKSDFLANMSHEIRTPINGIMGMIGLLSDSGLQPSQQEYVEAARVSAETLMTVINDILDFSKIEAGKMDFEDIEFDLLRLFDDVRMAFSFQARSKNLGLKVHVDPEVHAAVSGDPGRIRQVMNNLLSNALKFTGRGEVGVNVSSIKSSALLTQVRVEITDTGTGIPPAVLSRLFRPFTQADVSTTRRYGGTGLGLSICKHLVESMGGQIGVESSEGKGSKFWFTISLRTSSTKIPVHRGAAVGTFANVLNRPIRILVAEDNPINQKIAVKFLEKMGLRSDVAANGQEVLNALRTIPYDLVLMDCQMPELDGYEATRHIRGSRTLPRTDIPIIAMTANAMAGEKERCLEVGMNDYVSKPITPESLFQILSRWLVSQDGKTLVRPGALIRKLAS